MNGNNHHEIQELSCLFSIPRAQWKTKTNAIDWYSGFFFNTLSACMLRLSVSVSLLCVCACVCLFIDWMSFNYSVFFSSLLFHVSFGFCFCWFFISLCMRMHNNHMEDLKLSSKFENEFDARCLLSDCKLWAYKISELVSKRWISHRKENTPTKIEIDVLYNILLLYIVF